MVEGVIVPGQLITQTVLAQRCGVSPTPVREALQGSPLVRQHIHLLWAARYSPTAALFKRKNLARELQNDYDLILDATTCARLVMPSNRYTASAGTAARPISLRR